MSRLAGYVISCRTDPKFVALCEGRGLFTWPAGKALFAKRDWVEEARARVADNAVDFSSVKVQHV